MTRKKTSLYVSGNIALIRMALGITQEELGAAIGSNKPKVYNYEHGVTKKIPEVMVRRIAELGGVSIDRMYDTKLTRKELKLKPVNADAMKLNGSSNMLLKLVIDVQAKLNVVMRQNAAMMSEGNGKKYLAIMNTSNSDVEAETKKIIDKLSHY